MQASTSFGLSQIGQVALTVRDLDRAVEFYRDALGMRFLFHAGTLAFFDCDGVRLMLGLPERDEPARVGGIVYFRVEDIQAAHAALRDRGVEFEDAPHKVAELADREVWMAFFRDPAGNLLAVMSEPPRG
jgi:methylmalonyl-CoA/ethylmalonyl-CoA epimerase